MKRKIFVIGILSSVSALLCACAHYRINNNTDSPADTVQVDADDDLVSEDDYYDESQDDGKYPPNSLADLCRKEAATNYDYVQMAEKIGRMGDKSDEVRYDLDSLNQWYAECEAELVEYYNRTFAKASVKKYDNPDKALIMVDKIDKLFEGRGGGSTYDMLIYYGLEGELDMLRIMAWTKKILAQDQSFKPETVAWLEMQRDVETLCLFTTRMEWFGGSGAGPAISAGICSARETRIADLQNIYHHKVSKPNPAVRNDYKAATKLFCNKLEEVKKKAKKGMRTGRKADEDEKEYANAHKDIYNACSPVAKVFGNWLAVRSSLMGAGAESNATSGREWLEQCTASYIADLTGLIEWPQY